MTTIKHAIFLKNICDRIYTSIVYNTNTREIVATVENIKKFTPEEIVHFHEKNDYIVEQIGRREFEKALIKNKIKEIII